MRVARPRQCPRSEHTQGGERADEIGMNGMVGAVARRDDVMAQICELVRASDPAGADAFVREYYEQLGDDDLATWTTGALAQSAIEHWRFGERRAPRRAPDPLRTPFGRRQVARHGVRR